MGTEFNPSPCKRHYDLSMSKRTRKPASPMIKVKSPERSSDSCFTNYDQIKGHKLQDSFNTRVSKTSLKELFRWEEEEEEGDVKQNSLGNHFKEEEEENEKKHLQVLMKQEEDRLEAAVKFNGGLSRYRNFLRSLIKIKHDPSTTFGSSKKKPVLRLRI